ncbi:MAG: Holliday junction resolvase RuvX [Clostridia bacterium]|nr:Holliday junction resolvase RuvX [Clostridia bacterium]MDD4376026.1 Holliday junction resolvase RuvX [Clostridia bacterium]
MGRILAIDYGDVRVGLAVSDQTNIIATGLETLVINKNNKILIEKVEEIINEYDIETIVIGYPKNMDGSLSKKTEDVDKIVKKLDKFNIKIVKWDERLTTRLAYGTMKELGISQKQKNTYADKLAATTILQDYLKYTN